MARTIQSPGVEIKEVDLSLRPELPIGTTVLVPGFSQNGPTEELIQVTSVSDFEQIYGKPTTPVERYFYHTIRSSLNSTANVYACRMSYGANQGSNVANEYSALVYPVFPRPTITSLESLPVGHPLKTSLVNYYAAKSSITQEIHTITWTTTAGIGHPSGVGTVLTPTEGTMTFRGGLKTNVQESTAIPFDAAASDIKAGIESIPGVDTVNVVGSLASGWTITYTQPNYLDLQNLLVGTNTVKHVVPAVPSVNTEWSVTNSILSGGTFDIAGDDGTGVKSITIAYDATANDISTALTTVFTGTATATSKTAVDHVSAGMDIEFDSAIFTAGPTIDTTNVDPDGPVKDAGGTIIQILPTAAQTAAGTPGSAEVPTDTSVSFSWIDAAGNPYDFSTVYLEAGSSEIVVNYVNANGWKLTDSDTYFLGEPSNIQIPLAKYIQFQENRIDYGDVAGHVTEWKDYDELEYGVPQPGGGRKKGGMGLIMLNTQKLTINEKFEGYYLGIADNTNLNPATDFDGFLEMKGFNKITAPMRGSNYTDVPDVRLNFALSAEATGLGGSISEVMENVSPFDLNNQQFSDVLSIGVFKIRPSTMNPDITKLDYVLTEAHIGSCNFYGQQYLQEGGEATSFYVEDETSEAKSFRVIVNPNISKNGGDWYNEKKEVTKKMRIVTNKRESNYASKQDYLDNTFLDDAEGVDLYEYVGALQRKVLDAPQLPGNVRLLPSGATEPIRKLAHGENMYAHGAFTVADGTSRETGNIPAKLDRIFEVAENLDLYPLDIICEAGLGTVYVGTKGGGAGQRFDDEKYHDIDQLYKTQIQQADDNMLHYRTIANRFTNFCQTLRKDCIAVLDNLRYIYVQGKDVTVLQENSGRYFSKHIYWPLRHLFGTINTSYACTYGNWCKVADPASNRQVWVPPSGFIAASMANTDSNFQPWWAPAGFTRGILNNVNDVAWMPKQKHRDQMYKIGVNPIAMFPNDGFVIFGQKTLQSKPSAFDRINVRRMFLYAQRAVRQTIKYFVFEPNTLFTRQQVINVLTPIFERIKQTQGLYDYMIVCDDRNNPPDVIDQNEMVVDIYLKPVRSAEFILCNFYATRTSQDFSELIA